MRKYLSIIPILCGLVSCEKNETPDIVKNEIKKELNAQYNYNIDFYENSYSNPLAYYGDTVKYSVKFKSNTLIKYIQVYYTTGCGWKGEMYPNTYGSDLQTNMIWVNKNEDSLTYIYPLKNDFSSDMFYYIYNGTGERQKTYLIFDYHDSTGVVKSDTLPYFTLSLLDISNHQRLYNIAAPKGYPRGYSYGINVLNRFDFAPNINCGGPCLLTNDTSLFMVNIPNSDYNILKDSAITKDFIPGWFSPKKNHYFVKVTKNVKYYENSTPQKPNFDWITTTNHVKSLYQDNEPKMTKVENPKVGDLYAFRYIHTFAHVSDGNHNPIYSFGDVYGVIEITHIENDNLTSANGGNDLDYIEFRVKSFGMTYRFK